MFKEKIISINVGDTFELKSILLPRGVVGDEHKRIRINNVKSDRHEYELVKTTNDNPTNDAARQLLLEALSRNDGRYKLLK